MVKVLMVFLFVLLAGGFDAEGRRTRRARRDGEVRMGS
jgi:hypothetical protein